MKEDANGDSHVPRHEAEKAYLEATRVKVHADRIALQNNKDGRHQGGRTVNQHTQAIGLG